MLLIQGFFKIINNFPGKYKDYGTYLFKFSFGLGSISNNKTQKPASGEST